MATLYPSLEDMKGHQVLQVGVRSTSLWGGEGLTPRSSPRAPQLSRQAQAAAGVGTPATTVLTEKPNLPSAPPMLYPNLAELEDYMGLALSSEEIQKKLFPDSSTALTPAGPLPGQLVAPLSGNNAGLRRAEIKPGVREIHLCKDEKGKTGLQLRNIDQVRGWAGRGWARHGVVLHGMAWHSMAWHGAPRHIMAWHGIARHGTVLHGMAWCSMAWHGTAWHGTVLHGMARHGMAQHGMARCSTAYRGMAWHHTAWHSAPWHGTVLHSMAWHSTARHGVELHGMAWHSMAQHSAPWHGMAQHGMARCSTAWHGVELRHGMV
uniref:Syndecan binding protein 2 n=1 Tax=Anas zonorhyncha TaxID=75864 RepID=A0A8B9UWZ9_9AVES